MYKAIENGRTVFKPLTTSFNGIILEEALTNAYGTFKTIAVRGRGLLSTEHQAVEVAGRDGDYYYDKTLKPRTIEVVAKLTGKSAKDFRKQYSLLNSLLNVPGECKLLFSDEETFYYKAVYKEGTESDDRKQEAIITLSFICYDPKKYSDDKTFLGSILTYSGDYDTKPVITVTLSAGGSEFRLLHVEKQLYIRVTGTFIAGSVIAIDMSLRKITLNNRSILADFDMVNSRFFSLSKGRNTLSCNLAGTIKVVYKEVFA